MARPVGPDQPKVRAAQARLGMRSIDVWISYVAIGGTSAYHEVNSYLTGAAGLSASDVFRLAAALNEEFMARGEDHPVRVDAEPSLPELTTGPFFAGCRPGGPHPA